MDKGFTGLQKDLKKAGVSKYSSPVTYYKKMNPRTGQLKCDMVYPLKNEKDVDKCRAAGMEVGEYPGGKYSLTSVRGDYDFFPLGWYMAMSHSRMAGKKFRRSATPLETYLKGPPKYKPNDYQTEIAIPVR